MDGQQKCHRPDLQEKEQYQEFLDRYSLTITCKMLHLHVLNVTNSNSIPPSLRKGRPTPNLLGKCLVKIGLIWMQWFLLLFDQFFQENLEKFVFQQEFATFVKLKKNWEKICSEYDNVILLSHMAIVICHAIGHLHQYHWVWFFYPFTS
jgi:hypothetical protein